MAQSALHQLLLQGHQPLPEKRGLARCHRLGLGGTRRRGFGRRRRGQRRRQRLRPALARGAGLGGGGRGGLQRRDECLSQGRSVARSPGHLPSPRCEPLGAHGGHPGCCHERRQPGQLVAMRPVPLRRRQSGGLGGGAQRLRSGQRLAPGAENAAKPAGDKAAAELEIIYNTAISICEKSAMWVLALQLLVEVETLLGADEISYNAAISACEKCGEWQWALELLGASGSRSAVSFGAAIAACEKASAWQEALQLLSELGQDLVASSAAISACAKSQESGSKPCSCLRRQPVLASWT
ncbi:unnamed protein product [Effrenium voratum]|nr:unnamed protein product [Effrenium voratum]